MTNIKELKLMVDEFISVNHYLAYRVVGKRAMSYKTQEAKKFQKKFTEYVKEQAKLQNWEYDENPYQHYYVDAVFYFPRTRMDSSNYSKVIFDAITDSGVVWEDDDQACERVFATYLDSKNPRIELTIHPVDYVGIFKNSNVAMVFENKCKNCKRYKNNCSILRKSKEGRIQDEIDNDYNCSKYNSINNE